jgi:hypothetical protein
VGGAPRTPGVYVFRTAGGQAFPRLRGKSDIVYIGVAGKGKSTIRQRLKKHLTVRRDRQDAAHRLNRVVKEVRSLEVGWVSFAHEDEARAAESELFDIYARDHIELPPLDRQESGIKVRARSRLTGLLPADKRQEALAKLRAARSKHGVH